METQLDAEVMVANATAPSLIGTRCAFAGLGLDLKGRSLPAKGFSLSHFRSLPIPWRRS